jgi:hypothetical protein
MDISNSLKKIGLNPDNSIVIGAGILDTLGIRKANNIDAVVSGEDYLQFSKASYFKKSQHCGREVLIGEPLELSKRWIVLGKDQTLDDLKQHSAIIDGVRYITLEFLLAVKKSWLQEDDDVRQKDIDDVKLMEDYLSDLKPISKREA